MFSANNFEIVSARTRFAQQNQAWGEFSPEERRAWTLAIADFHPFTSSVNTLQLINQQVHSPSGVINLESWISIAKAFDAVGFTAQQWTELMMALHTLFGRRPELFEEQPAIEIETFRGQSRIWPRAEYWQPWQRIRDRDVTAMRATLITLDKNSPKTRSMSVGASNVRL